MGTTLMGAQKDAEWYDEMCRKTANARSEPPWCSPWFRIWQKVVEKVVERAPKYVVELGCGPGAMAEMLSEKLPNALYLGSDFSVVNIQIAQKRNLPKRVHFSVRDLYAEPVTVNYPEETVVVTVEFLEHVVNDVSILERLPLGTFVVFTVPDHDSEGHVRWHSSVESVHERYRPVIGDLEVEELQVGARRYYIGSGHRLPPPTTVPPTTLPEVSQP